MRTGPRIVSVLLIASIGFASPVVAAEGGWEITPKSEAALNRGLEWLAKNQGPKGNWDNEQLGLVSMGLLAFLSAGHLPGRGKYGDNAQRALDYILDNAKPSGLLNSSVRGHDMYNHGLATFVLGQVYGMTGDRRVGRALDRALQLIQASQCADGGWDYVAVSKPKGHDLSLTVMQAKALRSAMDCGLRVDPAVIDRALRFVRRCYHPQTGMGVEDPALREKMGMFSYGGPGGPPPGIAMTAIGVVCLQEFGQYDDPRLPPAGLYLRHMVKVGEEFFNKRMFHARKLKKEDKPPVPSNHVPFDAYTLYYLSQALYQRGGDDWRIGFTVLRDVLVNRQRIEPRNPTVHGAWESNTWWMREKGSMFYGTAIACFVLAMPNRYLPILQEGRVESLVRPVEAGKK